jgi:hypothetical protein
MTIPNNTLSIEEMFMVIGQQALRIYMLEKERDNLRVLVQDLNGKLEAARKQTNG